MTTGYVAIRAALVTQLAGFTAANPTIPVLYENVTALDLDAAPDVFVRVRIEFTLAKQANISPTPFKRQYGRVRATCFVRENLGTVKALSVLQDLTTLFEYQTLGGTHLESASPGGEARQAGWYSLDLVVPFFADSNA